MDADAAIHSLGNWTAGPGPLHRRLTGALAGLIRDGIVLPGARLPSERALADALAISRTTVVASYNALRSAGWVESRRGGGTRVRQAGARPARDRARQAELETSSLVSLLSLDADLLDLATGTTPPLARVIREAIAGDDALDRALSSPRQYWPLGLPALREAIARLYIRQHLPTRADEILVTNGAQQAVSLVSAWLVQRGDAVLVETPTYFGALDAFRLAGARLTGVPVDRSHIDPGLLRDRLFATGPRLVYLTPTHSNPTGVVMPERARKAVARMVEESGVTLVEDHTLAGLAIDGAAPPYIASYPGGGGVLTIGSLSKLCWGGLRIGWIRGTASAIRQLGRLKSAADLGSPLPTQALAVPLVGIFESAASARRAELGPSRDLLAALLSERLPEWTFRKPSGGLFLWVSLPGVDTRQFAQYAARHGVAVAHGAHFSVDEGPDDHLRLPFLLDEPSLREGVARLADAWRSFRRTAPARDARQPTLV
jgi:DNA-binding transcriptional MocR family regulator